MFNKASLHTILKSLMALVGVTQHSTAAASVCSIGNEAEAKNKRGRGMPFVAVMLLIMMLGFSAVRAQKVQSGVPILVADSLLMTDTATVREAPNRMPIKRVDAGEFRPRPMQAVWYSALFPGLGQIYNKKYWKIPIVIGGFVGIYYGYNWNGQNYRDYSTAYSDAMDDDPLTKSYLDILPIGTVEENIDMVWLKDVLRRRKDYFRRNRDLCIIGMVGLYGAAIIDAYVDASLYAFDISPDLSMKVRPTLFTVPRLGNINTGVCFAFRF